MTTEKQKKIASKLKGMRLMRYILSTVGVLIIVYGMWMVICLLVNYKRTETTNNAQIEQYVSPINVKVSGYIDKIHFTEHQFVRKGDTLLVIDDKELKLKVKEAQSMLEVAKTSAEMKLLSLSSAREKVYSYDANIEEVKANISQQEIDYKRYRNLLERKATTPIQVEQMKTGLTMSKAKLEALLAQKRTAVVSIEEAQKQYENAVEAIPKAEATAETALLNWSYCFVKAPCDGYLGRRSLEEGQLVSAGQTITNIIPDTQKWIIANYKETQIENLYIGQEVIVRIDAISNKKFTGKITAISEATGARYSMIPTDNSAGNFVKIQQRIPVRIDFTNLSPEDNRVLRAGMMAEVSAKLQ